VQIVRAFKVWLRTALGVGVAAGAAAYFARGCRLVNLLAWLGLRGKRLGHVREQHLVCMRR
jgi:hypothetical protein